MSQLSLIPQTIVTWYPAKRTASRPRTAQASDGLDYAVKHDEKGSPIRANEWVCAHIAQAVGIPVPHCIIVTDEFGERLFASQIYGDDIHDNRPIFMGSLPHQDIIKQISKIYAFDLFVYNTDRHINNYLIKSQNNKERIFAFDHSHSLFSHWPNIQLPMPHASATVTSLRSIKARWGFDVPSAVAVLEKLEKVPLAAVEAMIRGMPSNWLAEAFRDEFLSWWDKDGKTRTQEVKDGIQNGKFI